MGTQRIVSRPVIGAPGGWKGVSNATLNNPENNGAGSEKNGASLKQQQQADFTALLARAGYGGMVYPTTYETDEDTTRVEQPLYYFHPDHLGSSTLLTDNNGNPYQFYLNLPFGETMAEQKASGTYTNPYLFNGKELDEETGLYYYGARYYNPRYSVWLGVDPMVEEFRFVSSYAFCLNNPLLFIDPDGMKPTPSQAAAMAWHIYKGKKGQVVDGWTLSDVYLDSNNPGYKAGFYTREVDGVAEYAMVNMGTIPGTGKENRNSMWENVEQPLGSSDHMKLSLRTAERLSTELGPNADLTFIGHSKGGAEAAANAVATDRDAYLFNPAAVNLKVYGLNSKNYSASMTAFVVKGDPVAKTYPFLLAKPIDRLIMLPRQSWNNPIENHNNFGEALRQYLENNIIKD